MRWLGGVLVALAVLVGGAARAWADPFEWDDAEVRTIVQEVRGGERIVFRLGTVLQGSRFDTAVEAAWSGGAPREPVELLREMTDSRAEMEFTGGMLRVRWTAFSAGAARPSRVARCWRFAGNGAGPAAERCGGTSTMKDWTAKAMAMVEGMGSAMAEDEVVKNSMVSYAFEHFEISAYTALVAAAEACGDAQTKAVCQEILQEERAMADWLAQALPKTTQQFLARDAAGSGAAKR